MNIYADYTMMYGCISKYLDGQHLVAGLSSDLTLKQLNGEEVAGIIDIIFSFIKLSELLYQLVFFVSIFVKIYAAYVLHPCYFQHPTIEPHFCYLHILLFTCEETVRYSLPYKYYIALSFLCF